jgi:hypothetical protein
MGQEAPRSSYDGVSRREGLPPKEGSLELDNPILQGYVMLLAYKKDEEKELRHVDVDLQDLRNRKNRAVQSEMMSLWQEEIDNGSSMRNRFGKYRDNPKNFGTFVDPRNPEALEKLYESIFPEGWETHPLEDELDSSVH